MKLIDLIRQAADELPEIDPRELAKRVAEAAPARNLRELLAEASNDSCREYLRTRRNAAFNRANGRTSSKSKKLAEYREWWGALLASSVEIDSEWKPLGDCTVEDLQYYIDRRKQEIASIESRIADYYKLIDLIHRCHVTTVSEIPYDAAAQEFGNAA